MRKIDDKKNTGSRFITSVLLGAALGFLISFALFAVFAALITSGRISEGLMPYLTAFTAFLGAVLGAVASVKRYRGRLLSVGVCVGLAMLLVTVIGAVFSDSGRVLGGMTPVMVAVLPGGGIVGALLCLRRKKRKHA